MNKGRDGQVPCSESGHPQTQKRPNSVVVKRWDEHSSCTTRPKYVSPCSLVQSIVNVIYIAVLKRITRLVH